MRRTRKLPIVLAALGGLILGALLGAAFTAVLMAAIAGFLAWLFTRGESADVEARVSRTLPAAGAGPVARLSEEIRPAPGEPAAVVSGDQLEVSKIDYAMEFLAEARRRGLLNRSTYMTLHRVLELRREELLPAPAASAPGAPPATLPQAPPLPPPPGQPPAPARATGAAPPARRVEAPAPKPSAPARRVAAPPREPLVTTWMATAGRRGSERLRIVWRALASDFALHSITYIGVLLAVVVVFVFFAFGYFGEVFRERNLRPVAEVAIPVFFFGVAWVLRKFTGIPHTAAAVGLIGALILPVMMSAAFQDGSAFPPDINGPPRWFAYAAVGLICAAIYSVLAVRFQPSAYAYLVGPVLWAAIGSLGLFVRDGISAWQMVVVMAGMAATVPLAGAVRGSPLGKLVSAPMVQTTALSLPILFVVAVAFAYQDAVGAGTAFPTLRDVAPAGIGAALAAGIGFLLVGGQGFAWAGLADRLRRQVEVALITLAYLSLLAAWVFAAALGFRIGWIGASLLGYAAVVYALESRARQWTPVGPWAARAAIVGALALSLEEGLPTLVAWGLVALVVAGAVLFPPFRRRLAPVAPFPTDGRVLAAALWIPTVVGIVGGAARVTWPRGAPWVLASAAILLGGARFLPRRAGAVRSLASVPTIAVAVAALGVGVYRFATGGPLSPVDERFGPLALGVLLGMLAAAAALADVRWLARLPAVAVLTAASLSLVLRQLIGDAGDPAVVADTLALGMVGAVLFADSLVRSRSPEGPWHGLAGHLFVYAAWAVGLSAEPARLLGLFLLVASHAAEAVAVERWSSPLVSWLGGLAPRFAPAAAAAPAVVAATALPFLAATVAQQFEVIRSERPRSGLVLSAVSWAYVGGAAALRRSGRLRRVMTAGTFALSAAGIAMAAPSLTGEVLTVGSAVGATGTLAWVLRRPAVTVATWVLALVFELVLLSRLGVRPGDLHFVLFVSAMAMVMLPPALGRIVSGSRERGLPSAWLQPPVALGLLVLPVSLALAIADGRLVAPLALGAAAAYAMLGWLVGTWGVTVPACAMVAIAYPDLLARWASPFEEPILWIPLAAAFVAASFLLPGRTSWRVLDDPSPGLVVAGLATAALALALTLRAGGTGNVLLATSGLLALVFAGRRQEGWLYGSLGSLLAGGTAHGQGWSAAAAAFDAVVLGALATWRPARRQTGALIVVTTALVAYAYVSLAFWAGWGLTAAIAVTGAAAVLLAIPAMALSLRDRVHHALRPWLPPANLLGHTAAVSVVVMAAIRQAQDVGNWTAVTALTGPGTLVFLGEALLLGTLATRRPSSPWTTWAVAGATALLALAYGGLVRLAGWDERTALAVTGLGSATLAVVAATMTLRDRLAPPLTMWLPAAHALAQLGAVATVWVAVASLAPTGALAIVAMACGAEAGYLGALASRVPEEWRPREVAAGLLVAAGVAGTFAQGPPGGRTLVAIYVVAAAGLAVWVTAGLARDRLGPWEGPGLILGSGLALASVVLTAGLFGPFSRPTLIALAFVGADLVSYGVLTQRYLVLEAGLLVWFGSAMLFGREFLGANRHAYVVPTSVVLLAVLEIERGRLRRRDAAIPEPLKVAEWLVMILPVGLATVSLFGNLVYALLLAGEGAALLVWGIVSEVRRRALMGLAAITLAILLSASLPIVDVLRAGLRGNVLLGLGAVLAVVLIVLGSVLERNLGRIRGRIRRVGEIVEDWE